jgi:hypothetical protein
VGPRNCRGNGGGGKARGLITIKRDLREERKARERGQARPELQRCTNGGAEEGKGRKKGEGGADRWGPGVSGCGKKRRKEGGPLWGKEKWAGGPKR